MTSTHALIGLFWLPGLICLFFVVVKLCDWFVDMLYQPPKKLSEDWLPDPPNNDEIDYVLTDGFGNCWNKRCPECNNTTMYLLRPGKVGCSYCDSSARSDHLNDENEDNRTGR